MSKPKLTDEQAKTLVKKKFDLQATSVKPLPGFYDYNALIQADKKYVLKLAVDDKEDLDMQNKMMLFLKEKGFNVNIPIKTKEGTYIATYKDYNVRLLTYVEGELLNKIEWTQELLQNIGETLAQITNTLHSFTHPKANRYYIWDLKQFPTLKKSIDLAPKSKQKVLQELFTNFEKQVPTTLPQGVIHNDMQPYNILADKTKVVGIIDFGDAVHTYLVNELATTISEMLEKKETRNILVQNILQGYEKHRKLTNEEKLALPHLIQARLAMLYLNSIDGLRNDPTNTYIEGFIKQAWESLNWARKHLNTL